MNRSTDFARFMKQVRTPADAVRIACELEVEAPKLGNVHPGASFADCDYQTFIRAAASIASILGSEDTSLALGERVFQAVLATREVTHANVNLGIILLIAPLSMVRTSHTISSVLGAITAEDGKNVFEAIRLASPGGMKNTEVPANQDVQRRQSTPVNLIDAMKQASVRDRIALQYVSAFDDFFTNVIPLVQHEIDDSPSILEAIVRIQLCLMSRNVDSLIQRKCGAEIAEEARSRAADVVQDDRPETRSELDRWLRADGNRRNPGTTADLIAAALYWQLLRTIRSVS